MLRSMHNQLTDCGFVFDENKGRYFMKKEPVWDIQVKKAAGRRQGAFPASTVEEFKRLELQWVEETLRAAKVAKSQPVTRPSHDEEEAADVASEEAYVDEEPRKSAQLADESEEPSEKPKKAKKSKREEEVDEQVEEEEKPKKKKKRSEKEEE